MSERVTRLAEPTVDVLRQRLVDFASARRWEPFHTPKNLAAALSVEAGELLEIFQWLTPEQAAAVMSDPERAHRVHDEVADVLAYLLQFCTAVGVDPLEALAAKIERNELRFPVPTAAGAAGQEASAADQGAGGADPGAVEAAGSVARAPERATSVNPDVDDQPV